MNNFKLMLSLLGLVMVGFASVSITSDKDVYECGFVDGKWQCEKVTIYVYSDKAYSSVRIETPFEYKNAEIKEWVVKGFSDPANQDQGMPGKKFKTLQGKNPTIGDFKLLPGTTIITLEPIAHGSFKWNASVINNKNNEELAVIDPWFNSSWQYRVPFNLTTTTETLMDFQHELILNETNINYLNTSDDGSDIRVTYYNASSDEEVLISLWIQEWNESGNSKVWIKAPLIDPDGEKYYLYYGNPSASSVSNGEDVFEMFDDFNGGSLNTSIWSVENHTANWNYQVTDGCLYIEVTDYTDWFSGTAESYFAIYTTAQENLTYEAKIKNTSVYDSDTGHLALIGYLNKDNVYFWGPYKSGTRKTAAEMVENDIGNPTYWWGGESFFPAVFGIRRSGTTTYFYTTTFYDSDTLNYSHSSSHIGSWDKFGFYLKDWISPYGYYANFDWARARKHTDDDITTNYGSTMTITPYIESPVEGQTYLPGNITLSFTATIDGYHEIYLDEALVDNVSLSEGEKFTKDYSITEETNHTFYIQSSSYHNSNASVSFNVSSFFIENVTYTDPEYELSWTNISYTIRHTENITLYHTTINYNSITYNTSINQINETTANCIVTVPTPLVNQTTNKTDIIFTITATGTKQDNTTITTTTQATQTINKAYSIENIQYKTPILETSDTQINITIIRNGDAYPSLTTTFNNQQQQAQEIQPQTYQTTITVPTISQPEQNFTLTVNMSLSFNGQQYQNYETRQFTITAQQYHIFKCNGTGIPILKFYAKDEETLNPITVKYFMLRLLTHVGTGGSKEYAFKEENSESMEICMDPASDLYVNATLEYYQENYTKRYYQLVEKPVGQTYGHAAYNVFLLNVSDAFLNTFYVTDAFEKGIPNILVMLQRYYSSFSTFVTVESLQTDDNGKVELILDRTQLYRIKIANTTDNILKTFRPSIYKEDRTTLYYAEPEESLQAWAVSVKSHCSYDNTAKIVTCSYYSTEPRNITLNVTEGIIGGNTLCSQTKQVKDYYEITCDISHVSPRGSYLRVIQYIQYKGSWYYFKTTDLWFQKATEWIGRDLMITIALLMIITIGMAFSNNPILMTTSTYAAVLILKLAGIIEVSVTTLAGLGVAAALIIWVMK